MEEASEKYRQFQQKYDHFNSLIIAEYFLFWQERATLVLDTFFQYSFDGSNQIAVSIVEETTNFQNKEMIKHLLFLAKKKDA